MTEAIFIDLEKAYNKVITKTLIQKSIDANTPNQITLWVTNFLKNRTVEIESNTKIKMLVTNGLPQGDVISPTLFNLCTKDIHNKITNENTKLIQYADDFVIIARGKDQNELKTNLQTSLNSFINEKEELNLPINTDKTKYMIFNNKNQNFNLNIRNTHIEITNTYKYLGTIIDNKLKFHKHIEYLRNKAIDRLNILEILCAKNNNLDPQKALIVYRSTMRSIFETSSSYLNNSNKSNRKKINTTINQAIRKATGCTKTTPINTLNAIAAEIPFQFRS